MSFSISRALLDHLRQNTGEGVANYYAGGMSSACPVIPDNVLVWRTCRDLAPERTRSHQRFVLKVVLRGRNTTILDGCRFRLGPGDAILIHPFQFHANAELESAADVYELLVVTFTERFDGGRALDVLRNRSSRLGAEEFALLEEIAEAFRRRGRAADAGGVGLLALLLSRLAVNAGDAAPSGSGRIDEIAARLRDHFTEPLSLKEICVQAGISEATLRRGFRERFGGLTPGRLILSLRMQRAAELLCRSELRIGEVGAACGFSDPFVFSRAFRRYANCSPQEYRRRNRVG